MVHSNGIVKVRVVRARPVAFGLIASGVPLESSEGAVRQH
jgi:hypothetical protein